MDRPIYPRRRSLHLSISMATALKQVATWRECSQSEIIRGAVEDYLRKQYGLREARFPEGGMGPLPGQLGLIEGATLADNRRNV